LNPISSILFSHSVTYILNLVSSSKCYLISPFSFSKPGIFFTDPNNPRLAFGIASLL